MKKTLIDLINSGNECTRGQEMYKIYKSLGRPYYQYTYRAPTGELYRTGGLSLKACRAAKEDWLSRGFDVELAAQTLLDQLVDEGIFLPNGENERDGYYTHDPIMAQNSLHNLAKHFEDGSIEQTWVMFDDSYVVLLDGIYKADNDRDHLECIYATL
jgi:hypothetical protein